jgi:hypothetical protein
MGECLEKAAKMSTAVLNYGIPIENGFFDSEKHLYRCSEGIVRPSSTQVFDILGMSDFSAIPEDVLEWKRQYGMSLHSAVEYLTQGDLDWDSVDEAIISSVTGVEQFLLRFEYQSEACEELKIRTLGGMKYGTRLDNRGTILFRNQRKHVIVDFKTGSKASRTWDWQLGSYSVEQPKVDGGWIGLALQIGKDGDVKPFWVLDLERARREFQVLLAAALLKINAGLASVGK